VPELGHPVLDRYLAFVAGRCRPNTVLATACPLDLKAFFAVVEEEPDRVEVEDVLAFSHQQRRPRGDGNVLQLSDGESGLSSRTIQRRLSTVRLGAAGCDADGVENFVGESGQQWTYDPCARIGDDSGFGQVFCGTGVGGQSVAVKRVGVRQGNEGELRRREREVEIAQALRSLRADHLLPVLDVARVGSDLLLVMPRATRSLAAALEARDLDQQGRLEAVADIARGLMELAAASVLHRDLKPANVLELEGRWQLADFGIARNLFEDTGTFTFMGVGTMPYMAPELWQGQAATVKSDLYALGVLGYEVLTGSRPFGGPGEAEFRHQHQYVGATEPVGVPAATARLLLRMLAKNPAERPADARVVVEALEPVQKRLTTQQDELRKAALLAEQRRGQQEVAHAAAVSADRVARDRRTQAIADLQEILDDAADLAHDALPEARLTADGAQWHLRWEEARVTFVLWPGLPSADVPGGDPLVMAGSVHVGNRGQAPAANIVCEAGEDRMTWSLLRFTASAFVGNKYAYGPLDRPHGFDQHTFASERVYMVRPCTHVWNMQRLPLTPECVVELLREAIGFV
jgi:hypothetical protein